MNGPTNHVLRRPLYLGMQLGWMNGWGSQVPHLILAAGFFYQIHQQIIPFLLISIYLYGWKRADVRRV